jgi:hypothetical protein
MKSTFLNALAQDGGINEQAMSVESLGRIFGPLQRQVKESVQKQEALVADVQASSLWMYTLVKLIKILLNSETKTVLVPVLNLDLCKEC